MKIVLSILAFAITGISLAQTCDPLTGTARPHTEEYLLNPFKNRTHAPTASQIKTSITFDKILQPGNDINRFHNTDGAEIEGYMLSAEYSAHETCNCDMTAKKFRDIHIRIAKNAHETDLSKIMIVEITPKIRATKPVAWSLANIQKLIGHKVKFTGWMLFDAEHKNVARNTRTNPNTKIKRATCWEIHPVTYLVALD